MTVTVEPLLTLAEVVDASGLGPALARLAMLHGVAFIVHDQHGAVVARAGLPAAGAEGIEVLVAHAGEPLGVVVAHASTATGDDPGAAAGVCALFVEALYASVVAQHEREQRHRAALEGTHAELSRRNRQLADAVDRLRELDRMKSVFLATISHELRTPLTSVIGYAEMLLDGLAGSLTPEQREYVGTIMEKGDELLQVISSILDVSRSEAGLVRLVREPVELGQVVESAVGQLHADGARKRLSVRISIARSVPRVYGDPGKLRQVVHGLLANAIKFSPHGGLVEVAVEVGALTPSVGAGDRAGADEAGDAAVLPDGPLAVRLLVRDQGIGISSELQVRIFEPFYQIDAGHTREYGGIGLGLTLVKNLVEAHGGRVWVASELGRGSDFTVTLPAVEAELAAYLGAVRAAVVVGGGVGEVGEGSDLVEPSGRVGGGR